MIGLEHRVLALAVFWALSFAAHSAETVTYVHSDLLGSPIAETDASGNIVRQSDPRSYGEDTVASNSGIGYTGHFFDTETALVYMDQRYYDPAVGRFLTTDPIVRGDSNLNFNRYNYARNNPYKYVDPDGRWSKAGERGWEQPCDLAINCSGVPIVNPLTGRTVHSGNGLGADSANGTTQGAAAEGEKVEPRGDILNPSSDYSKFVDEMAGTPQHVGVVPMETPTPSGAGFGLVVVEGNEEGNAAGIGVFDPSTGQTIVTRPAGGTTSVHEVQETLGTMPSP